MAKELQRDLGLLAVFMLCTGASIGSGIFVLPGLAAGQAGPAVIVAYLAAGLITLPAALSQAELATAMPESGGAYHFLDRAFGPLVGTISGLGTWMALALKAAFALVGLVAYLTIILNVLAIPGLPSEALVAGLLGAVLVAINIKGAKHSGTFQSVVVSVVLIALTVFVVLTTPAVETSNWEPFSPFGSGAIATTTAFVFVSYIGITKIASVAGEIEDPGRNIPLGVLGSLTVLMILYTVVTAIVVGVTPFAELAHIETPMATTAEAAVGPLLVLGIGIVAILGLLSMANAGVMTASRYPFAMSRDELMPEPLRRIDDRFMTPRNAILLTGGVILLVIAVLPVQDIAELASAFNLVVFALLNLAVVAMRGSAEDYDPEFTSPGYPIVQILGVLAPLGLLAIMHHEAQLVVLLVVGAGAIWYVAVIRGVEREGAAVDALRRRSSEQAVAQTQDAIWQQSPHRILIPLPDHVSPETEDPLLRVAASLVSARGGGVRVMEFEEVPDQVILDAAAEVTTEEDVSFEDHTGQVAQELDIDVEVGQVVSHDTGRAVVNYVERSGVDLVLMDVEDTEHASDHDMEWFMDHLPCDSIYVVNEGVHDAEEILVVTDQGAYDPLKVAIANTIALQAGARIRFLQVLPDDAPDSRVQSAQDYLDDVVESTGADAVAEVVRADDRLEAAMERVRVSDLVVLSAHEHRLLRKHLVQRIVERIQEEGAPTALLVHAHEPRSRRFVGDVVDRVLYD